MMSAEVAAMGFLATGAGGGVGALRAVGALRGSAGSATDFLALRISSSLASSISMRRLASALIMVGFSTPGSMKRASTFFWASFLALALASRSAALALTP